MTKYNNKNLKWFTLIELVVSITIIAILSVWGFNMFKSYSEDLIIDNEYSDIRQIGLLMNNIISKSWDIPLWYCKNSSGWYDSNCFKTDPNLNGTTDSICEWKDGDLSLDNDCDQWCVVVDCSVNDCNWNNEYYDFTELFNKNINYNYTLHTDTFYNKLWYVICPEKDPLDNLVIWKGMETEFWTFNPSFTLYYNWRPVYNYNSNP